MKKSDNEVFENNLVMGTEGEDIVYAYLVANNSLVQDLRAQKHDSGFGPRLFGREGKVVLPDFAVYNKYADKGNFLLDVKVKKSIYPVDKFNGQKCFTVDYKYEDYRRCKEIMRFDTLQFAFVYRDEMYFYKETDCLGATTFANQYSNGNVYCFAHDRSKIRK